MSFHPRLTLKANWPCKRSVYLLYYKPDIYNKTFAVKLIS